MKTIERHYMMATDEALKEALEVILCAKVPCLQVSMSTSFWMSEHYNICFKRVKGVVHAELSSFWSFLSSYCMLFPNLYELMDPIDFHTMPFKSMATINFLILQTFFKTSSFAFNRRKKHKGFVVFLIGWTVTLNLKWKYKNVHDPE